VTVLSEILRRQPGVGVIVITGFATFESAVEAMKMGAVDYQPKLGCRVFTSIFILSKEAAILALPSLPLR
jgi:ActR/RegA family two-component response regulator